MTSIATFDVFDTLLTRAVGAPRSLFVLLGRQEPVARITGCSPGAFAQLRVAAERRARRGRGEITLLDIYRELGTGLALDPLQVDALQRAEIALEVRLSRVVPSARSLLVHAGADLRVAMSDMYLPRDVVRDLLDRAGLGDLIDEVHVSGELGTNKATAGLYRLVQRDRAGPFTSWRHHGDNAFSDVRVPRLLGITTRPVLDAKLNRYEHLWDSYAAATDGFSALMAGASRTARLNTASSDDHRAVIDVAAGVAAPIMTAYVLWVLHAACRERRRLYFLARDGEILYLIARRLADRLGLDVDLHYLYGSRSVYHRASLATKDVADATWAWSAMYRLTPVAVLCRLGLSPEQAIAELARLGLQGLADEPASPATIELLVHDAGVQTEVRGAATRLLGRVRRYLAQEGMLDGGPYAIVDTGWAGRIAQSLSDVLPPDAQPLDRGYFFGHMKRESGFQHPEALSGYLFDEWAGTGFRGDFEQAYGPIETFTAANEGMTVDFVGDGDRIRPVLTSETNPALRSWPWSLYRQVILDFVESLVLDADIAHTGADLRAPVAAVLNEFWLRPTPDEARVWGGYVYEDDILAESRNTLASPITIKDFVGKSRSSYEGKRLWMPASVLLSPPGVRPLARTGLWINAQRQKRRRGEDLLSPRARDRVTILNSVVRFRMEARRLAARGERRGQ